MTKGRPTGSTSLRWIFRSVFTPLNSTARYIASWQKRFFDFFYIGGALVAAFALFGIALAYVWQSFSTVLSVTGVLQRTNAADVLSELNANVATTSGIPIKIVAWLFIGTFGAYCMGQAARAIVVTAQQFRILAADRAAVLGRISAIAIPFSIGAALIFQMAIARFPGGALGWKGVAFLVVVFVAFELGRAILQDFLVGFFGDVQIYCTHDENSTFFDLRERILQITVDAIRRAISPSRNGGTAYDHVIVLAHSLGATIAMDAILRCYQLKEQGGIADEDFARLRAFLTLGASLEKTKYFFDVTMPSRSLSYGQWRSDVYGALFTDDPTALGVPNGGAGMLWVNYWYFQDPICNQIESYRSYLRPGESVSKGVALRSSRQTQEEFLTSKYGIEGRVICRNEQGHKRMSVLHPMLHSDYLYDDWFWNSSYAGGANHLGALEIIGSILFLRE